MTIVWREPSRRRAARSAAYDTESVDPLVNAIGRLTFHMDVPQPATSSAAKSSGRGIDNGTSATHTHTPIVITAATYNRAGCGSEIHRRIGRGVMDCDRSRCEIAQSAMPVPRIRRAG